MSALIDIMIQIKAQTLYLANSIGLLCFCDIPDCKADILFSQLFITMCKSIDE